MPITLAIANTTHRALPCSKRQITQWITDEILKRRGRENYIVELLVVGTRRIRALNYQYRRRGEVTDVLSFPIEPPKLRRAPKNQQALGSIVFCLETAEKQAQQSGIDTVEEVEKLIRHSTKHLLGIHHRE